MALADMAIHERIRFIRILRGMTEIIGDGGRPSGANADIRIEMSYLNMFDMFHTWQNEAKKLKR